MIIYEYITKKIVLVCYDTLFPKFQTFDIKYMLWFNKGNFLKRGWDCALLLFIKIRRAHFCNFHMRFHSKPQFAILNRCKGRHQMETFSALMAFCAGNSPVTGEFPARRPVTRSFGVFLELRLDKRFSKQHEAGDLRRHRTHCDVTVMKKCSCRFSQSFKLHVCDIFFKSFVCFNSNSFIYSLSIL